MVYRGQDRIEVQGLGAFRRELKQLDDAASYTKLLSGVNREVADLVIFEAKTRAYRLGGMEARAAESLRASNSSLGARVSGGGSKAPFFEGAEFGAYRNKLRLRKNTGGRNYIVRNETARELRQAIKRIESQSNINTRQRTKVIGQVRGWNQFREWRGNKAGAGYFLFPAIRENENNIVEMYGEGIERVARTAFPD
jgi:hypothetical protein